jgi:RNA polymerase sigma-70 factor (ECF subfamily)
MTPERAFDLYHRAVYSFAYRLTRRPAVAEDLTQECFLAMLRAPHRYDPARGSLKVYLFSIMRNLELKQYHHDLAERPIAESEDLVAPDPRRAIEVSSAVSAAVAALPLLQREALVLFEYEGVSLEEIAQIVGAEVGTVKSRLHRARERLRQVLAPYREVAKTNGTV